MIGNKSTLTNLQVSIQDSLISGDGARGRIIGTDSLIIPGLSRLKDVLLVEGLTINLISVRQICNENLLVQFIRDKCITKPLSHYGKANDLRILLFTDQY